MDRRTAAFGAAVRVLLCASALVLGGACRSSEQRAREADVARVAHAVDALRNAPNAGKAPLLDALRQTACESAPACELKQLCGDAYTKHSAALDATAKAKALLDAPDGGSGAALEAAKQLTLAEQELEAAKTLSERCATRQGELVRQASAR